VRRIPDQRSGGHGATVAFSPDGKVLALSLTLTTIQLFDTETWKPFARLEGPDSDLIGGAHFTPDGTRLLVSNLEGFIRIWDLRLIREQLAAAGLDWAQRAYPPAPPPGDVKPLRVEVDESAYERLITLHEYLDEGGQHTNAARWPQA